MTTDTPQSASDPANSPDWWAARSLRISAQRALEASDVTVLRCVEEGMSLPSEWRAYRDALRDVVTGLSATLPIRPAYPTSDFPR